MSLFVRKDIGALLAEAGAGRCAGSWGHWLWSLLESGA